MGVEESIKKLNGFSLRFAKHIGSTLAGYGNIALSPLSVHVALAILAAGAKGATREQILSIIGSPALDDLASLAFETVTYILADGSAGGGPRVAFANGIWFDASLKLKEPFREVVESGYRATTTAVDFTTNPATAAQEVNSWVQNVTSGLIKELLHSSSVPPNTRLITANALYFKGMWKNKFDSAKTTNSVFHLLNGSSIQVPYMTSKNEQLISSHDGFKVLRLPYKKGYGGRKFSMYIFLPNARDGLRSLSAKLSDAGSVDGYLPTQHVAVGGFQIPRFKVSFGSEISSVLKSMGLVLPFSPSTVGNDLSEMADSTRFYVSRAFHNSIVEVNEEGAEARRGIRALGVGVSTEDFVADHPFMFLIREDKYGVVMFVGHVLNPSVA